MILLLIQIAKRKKKMQAGIHELVSESEVWFSKSRVFSSDFFLKMFFERKKIRTLQLKVCLQHWKSFCLFSIFFRKVNFRFVAHKKVGSELSPATVFLERMLDESSFVLRCPKYFCKHALTLLQTLLCNLLRVPGRNGRTWDLLNYVYFLSNVAP